MKMDRMDRTDQMEQLSEYLLLQNNHDPKYFCQQLFSLPDINESSPEYKNTLLHLACYLGNIQIVDAILCHGPNIELRNKENETPLHIAAAKGHYGIVNTLLGHGAKVDPEDKQGKMPVYYASLNGHRSVANLLTCHISRQWLFGDTK